jgi:hypothetical protein
MPQPKPGQPQSGGTPETNNPNAVSLQGIGPENFEVVFAMHRHDGTSSGGQTLFGPYFVKDPLGRPWKLVVSVTGVLGVVKAF